MVENTTVVYFLLNVEHGTVKLVAKTLQNFSEIIDLHEVYGRFDIIAKGEFSDEGHLKNFYQNKLALVTGIRRTETLVTLPSDLVSPLEAFETPEPQTASEDEQEDQFEL